MVRRAGRRSKPYLLCPTFQTHGVLGGDQGKDHLHVEVTVRTYRERQTHRVCVVFSGDVLMQELCQVARSKALPCRLSKLVTIMWKITPFLLVNTKQKQQQQKNSIRIGRPEEESHALQWYSNPTGRMFFVWQELSQWETVITQPLKRHSIPPMDCLL